MTDILAKLRNPAIGLIVSGCINGCLGALALLSGLLRFSGIAGKEKLPTEQAEKIGYLVGTFGGYGIGLLSLIVSPIIIYGAMKMMKGQSRGLAMAAAILSILPLTSCCFVLSGIFGIWAIIVLFQADVKAFFLNGGEQQANYFPPQPPRNW